MIKIFRKSLLAAAMLYLSLSATAQNLEEIKKVFPNENYIYTDYNRNLKIFMKDGVPVAETKMNISLLMLTDKNSNMMTGYSVYHSNYNKLTNLDVYTKIPNGKRFKEFKVKDIKASSSTSSSVFYDDGMESSFMFPGLTQYSTAHVDYSLFHKDAHLLTPFYIPAGIASLNSSFTVTVPDGIYINYKVQNDPDKKFIFSEEKQRNQTVYKWQIKNTEGEKRFYNAPDSRYYIPHVIIYITGYDLNKVRQPFLNDVKELYSWNYSFLKDLNKTGGGSIKPLVDSLIKFTSSDFEKAKAIYNWVQNHIKYIAFENEIEGFRPRQAEDVYLKRYGDCKDMSSLLTQMFTIAGLNAYYTWIGTRDIPYVYSELPSPIVDNHMISVLKIDNKWYFADGTNAFATLNLPPSFIQGKEALVAKNEKEFEIIKVPVASSKESVIVDSTFINITPNGINGYETVDYSGYFGEDVYRTIAYKNQKDLQTYVKSRMGKASNKFILGDFKITPKDKSIQLINIKGDFEIPDYGKKAGNNYFINLNLEKLLEGYEVDTSQRNAPVENEYKFTIIQHHILNVPQEYKVSEVPANFEFDNEFIKYKITYKVTPSQVIATQELENKYLLINPSDFAAYNAAIKSAAKPLKEMVVLEKNN